MSSVLVIDDEVSIRRVLRSILEQAGYTVFDAPDGREGLALWRREPTDVVVTDIFMPEKDGVEVIMEMTAAKKSKIIAISGGGKTGGLEWRKTALSLGADRVLDKPFDPKTLLSTIQEVLTDVIEPVPLPSSADQRKHRRVSVYLPVFFSDGGLAQAGTVLDISREGCRIHCPAAALEMKYFQVEIRLDAPPELMKVDLAVRRWSSNGELGVEFIRMDPDHQARLGRLIRNCEGAAL